jgi:hypothetical protein
MAAMAYIDPEDSDDGPLATAPPGSRQLATPPQERREATSPQEEKTPWAEVFGLAELRQAIVGLAILGGVCYGIYAGAVWVKEEYFDTAETVRQKAIKCYADAQAYHLETKKCVEMAERAMALEKREKAEKFCKDQGLRFKGTIGDQVECEP